jgi:hypothetical protein
MTAWVDSETRYPVKWQRGGETRNFTELPAPDGLLKLPPEVSDLFQGAKRDREKLKQPVPSGG